MRTNFCFLLSDHDCFSPLSFFSSYEHSKGGILASQWRERPTKAAAGVINIISQKKLAVLFLQETHTNRYMRWTGAGGGQTATNCLRLASYTEIVPGRLLAVRVEIQGISFILVNVYAPNQGLGRLDLFQKLSSFVQQCEQD